MMKEHEDSSPLERLPSQATLPVELPGHVDDGLWHGVVPDLERAVCMRMCKEIAIAYAAFGGLFVGLHVSGQYDWFSTYLPALIGSFFGSLTGPFIRTFPSRYAQGHLGRTRALRAYQVGTMEVRAVGDNRRPHLCLKNVKKVLVWHDANGTPKGIVLRTGRIARKEFWELTDMPHFVAAVLRQLPESVPVSFREMRNHKAYRQALMSYCLGVAAVCFIGGLLSQPIGGLLAVLYLLAVVITFSLQGLMNPRGPNL